MLCIALLLLWDLCSALHVNGSLGQSVNLAVRGQGLQAPEIHMRTLFLNGGMLQEEIAFF
jgi:hypothetical protein